MPVFGQINLLSANNALIKRRIAMNVVCPKCNATYQIPDDKVPNKSAFLTCKRCSHRIAVPPRETFPDSKDALQNDVPLKNAVAHPGEMVEAYPQVSGYDSRRYLLNRLLTPDRKGRYKTRLNSLKLKMLEGVKPILDRLLDEDEHVGSIAGGTAYYPLELILGNGVLTILYNRYVLAATDKRIIAINTNYTMNKPSHYLFQFSYDEMKKVSKGLFGTSLTLTRKRGKRRVFTAIKQGLAREMRDWVLPRIDPHQSIDPSTAMCDKLCPACLTPLSSKLVACPQCRAVFKMPVKAALRSLLLPGWGDIYLGHRFLGCCEAFGSLLVWGLALTMISAGQLETIAVGMFLLLVFNGMDALLTLHMAKKGYGLEKKQPLTP